LKGLVVVNFKSNAHSGATAQHKSRGIRFALTRALFISSIENGLYPRSIGFKVFKVVLKKKFFRIKF
jgi:hypothetical protein